MYPAKKDCQNSILIKLIDIKNNYQIRTFWTQKPEMFLKMYTFIQDHEMDIEINPDYIKNDPYDRKIGTIEDIIFSAGGKDTYNCIKVYVEVRDYR